MNQKTNYLFLLTFFIVQMVFPQDSGTIIGSVKNSSGDPEEGVHIFLVQTPYGTSSRGDGNFEFKGIPYGQYEIAVSKVGFQEQRKQLLIESDQVVQMDIELVPTTYHLDEVAIYGQERKTVHAIRLNIPLGKTPLSINIVPNETLKQQQAINLEDALKNVSGVSKFGSYGLSDNINIRGFTIGLAGGPENYRVDGVMLRTPYSDYIEQIQVLKGPASILYGDVEPGGIINYVTKKPLGYEHASLEIKTGEYGLFRPSIDIGGTLTDNLSYRLNTVYESSNSFRDDVFNRQYMIAPSLLWRIGQNTSLNINSLFMSNETTIDWGAPVFLPLKKAEELDDSNFYGYPDGTSDGRNNAITSIFTHNFAGNWQLRNTTSYSNQNRLLHDVYPVFNEVDETVDFSFGDYSERSRTNTFSNFLDISKDFNTNTIKHKLHASIDFSHITRPVSANSVFPILNVTSLQDPIWENTALSSTPALDDDILPFTTRFGLNLQDLVSFFDDKLNVLFGGRYSQFTTGAKYRNDAEEPADNSDTKESRFTPRLGLTYELIKGLTLYGSYAESFSSVVPDPGRGFENPEPLIGDQIEFGAKQSLFNNRLGVTLSYFDLNRKNVLQFNIINPSGSISDPNNFRANQSGEHNSRGLEIDINGKLKSNWQVLSAFSYFKTKVISEIIQAGDGEPVDFAGKELPNNPNLKFSLWTYYTLERGIPGLSFGGGIFHQGDMFGDRLNTGENTIESFTRVDLSMAYQYKNMKIQLNANNVGNISTFQRSIFDSYVPQYPRRLIASLSFEL